VAARGAGAAAGGADCRVRQQRVARCASGCFSPLAPVMTKTILAKTAGLSGFSCNQFCPSVNYFRMLQRTRTLSDNYFVATKRRGRPRQWAWEIQRRSKPLGVRLNGDGFKSEFAAKLAGEKALREFLDALAQEENV
jgi:hypothetical protein